MHLSQSLTALFVHLDVHSAFSFLDGSSSVESLVLTAALGYKTTKNEYNVWASSMMYMNNVLSTEDQRVTLKDIGTVKEITDWAKSEGAAVHEMELTSQFRCNGSDGYLAWLDDVLQIRTTANETLEGIDYDFRVIDSPNELREMIVDKNEAANKARLVAGYCWDWKSKSDYTGKVQDIVIGQYGFAMRWNLATDGSLWLVKPDSVNEIGCIHTCQGLELDYVGVIIGPDLIVRDGVVITNADKRSSQDQSVRGYKTLLKQSPTEGREQIDLIIKNTYRTLMTRGQKGCYIFCTDPETQQYFAKRLSRFTEVQ